MPLTLLLVRTKTTHRDREEVLDGRVPEDDGAAENAREDDAIGGFGDGGRGRGESRRGDVLRREGVEDGGDDGVNRHAEGLQGE